MRKYLVFLVLFALAGIVSAQGLPMRQLPVKGERGRLGEPQPLPSIVVSGKTLRLAPGGVVFDQNNRTVVHGNIPAQAEVLYTKDMNGDIQRMYILTEDERQRLERAPRN